MKKVLMFEFFESSDELRNKEISECISHNLSLGFDEIIIFNDSVNPKFSSNNIKNILSNYRMTYRDYLNYVNDEKNFGCLVVLTNTDIKLDKKILQIDEYIKNQTLFSISRWEKDGSLANMPWLTQDTWIMLSQPVHTSALQQSSFFLGLPGCELRFSEIIFNIGFAVFNPCLEIKNIHCHYNYKEPNRYKPENTIYGAYLYTPPCSWSDIRNGNGKILPIPYYLTNFSKKLFNIQ